MNLWMKKVINKTASILRPPISPTKIPSPMHTQLRGRSSSANRSFRNSNLVSLQHFFFSIVNVIQFTKICFIIKIPLPSIEFLLFSSLFSLLLFFMFFSSITCFAYVVNARIQNRTLTISILKCT